MEPSAVQSLHQSRVRCLRTTLDTDVQEDRYRASLDAAALEPMVLVQGRLILIRRDWGCRGSTLTRWAGPAANASATERSR